MLTSQQIRVFHREGFIKGSKVLSDDAIQTLRVETSRIIQDRCNPSVPQPVLARNIGPDESRPFWQIVNAWQASAAFRSLIDHSTIVEEVAQLTEARTLRIWHDQIQYKPAHTGGVYLWHQDAPYWPILRPATQVTAWVALDDADEGNGCMSMVVGSHLWRNQIDFLHTLKRFEDMPDEFMGERIEIRLCPVARGEVHYHHALTWHGSHANLSNRPRRAVALHYMTEETCFVAAGQHPMKAFVQVEDGEPMKGDAFPVVWESPLMREARGKQQTHFLNDCQANAHCDR